MHNALISVMVPIYNVAPYLDRCVSSLVNQTYRNLEILLVDDGSTDGSGQLADNWGARDPRITVFHRENGGIASTRNFGLDHARGQYLSFVDSDDFVDETFIQVLYDTLVSNGVKMSVIGYQRFSDEKDIVVDRTREWVTAILSTEKTMSLLFEANVGDYTWNKLYSRELFSRIRYPVGRVFEDVGTTYFLVGQCNRIAYCPVPLYFYRQRVGSITHSVTSKIALDRYEIYRQRYQYLNTRYPELLINKTYFLSQIFESFPDLPPELRVAVTAEAAGIVKSLGRELSLKTRLKFLAIQTVPDLYAWNKKRKKEKKLRRLASSSLR